MKFKNFYAALLSTTFSAGILITEIHASVKLDALDGISPSHDPNAKKPDTVTDKLMARTSTNVDVHNYTGAKDDPRNIKGMERNSAADAKTQAIIAQYKPAYDALKTELDAKNSKKTQAQESFCSAFTAAENANTTMIAAANEVATAQAAFEKSDAYFYISGLTDQDRQELIKLNTELLQLNDVKQRAADNSAKMAENIRTSGEELNKKQTELDDLYAAITAHMDGMEDYSPLESETRGIELTTKQASLAEAQQKVAALSASVADFNLKINGSDANIKKINTQISALKSKNYKT